MRQRTKPWTLLFLPAFLLALAAFSGSPAGAARRPTVPRFFDGVATDAGDDTEHIAWVAIDGSAVYGVFLSDFGGGGAAAAVHQKGRGVRALLAGSDLADGVRLFGSLRRNRITGSVYDAKNRRVGSFRGAVRGGAVSGSYSAGGFGRGSWEAGIVSRDVTGTADLDGRYLDPHVQEEGGAIAVVLNARRGTLSISGSYHGRSVAAITGKWTAGEALGPAGAAQAGVGADGALWILARVTRYTPQPGFPSLLLPNKNIPVRLDYVLDGDQLTLLDPETGDEIGVLKKQ